MLQAKECTLYSGGHQGTEAFFGECAEKWNVNEVTFSYEGHAIKREKNVVNLSPDQLRQGDVSIEIVNQRLHRNFKNETKIKNILQSIFHMINKGSQVFAVGVILDDDTVKGGTGWGVALGKFLNRDVTVFDKEKKNWFRWEEGNWVKCVPVIREATFCGTGSRYLTDEAKNAISDLFKRSFEG